MTALKVCYRSGVAFDEHYYFANHIPMAGAIMGSLGMKTREVVKIAATPDGSSPPYQYIFTAYFESPAALQACLQSPTMAAVIDDVKNYYDAPSDVMIGEVVNLAAAR